MYKEEPIIQVRGISKKYVIRHEKAPYKTFQETIINAAKAPFNLIKNNGRRPKKETFWALRDITFDVNRGEVIGIIGRNGAGKTTLLKILSRITEPTEGMITLRGRVASLLEVGTGFHPELTGRENIYLNGSVLGMTKKEIDSKFDEIVKFAETEKFLDTPVKRYSSGMYVRLAFAVAAHMEPEILLVDEVLAVGDYEFQKKCLSKMGEVAKEGRTVLLVSHKMSSITGLTSHCILINHGRIAMSGESSEVVRYYVSTVQEKAGEVVWNDPQTAPGSENIKLHAVRALSPDGQVNPDLDIQQEIVLRVSYWNLKEGNSPIVSIIVRNQMDDAVFASVNLPSENTTTDPYSGSLLPVGLFETECCIPANLLNTMTYSLDLHLNSKLHKKPLDIAERNIISFTVHDMHGRDTTGINWQGSVRPKLAWRTRYVGSLEEV